MWFYDYYIWMLLDMQFMAPARMIARNDAMEEWMKMFNLDKLMPPLTTICKP